MLTVIYAQDIQKVAEFYARTLAWPITQREPGVIIVGDAAAELAVVRVRDDVADANPVTTPPRLREETPLKPSFMVADLEVASQVAAATGGGAKPLATAWRWRGQLHLDGHDPEGNPVQFRVPAVQADDIEHVYQDR